VILWIADHCCPRLPSLFPQRAAICGLARARLKYDQVMRVERANEITPQTIAAAPSCLQGPGPGASPAARAPARRRRGYAGWLRWRRREMRRVQRSRPAARVALRCLPVRRVPGLPRRPGCAARCQRQPLCSQGWSSKPLCVHTLLAHTLPYNGRLNESASLLRPLACIGHAVASQAPAPSVNPYAPKAKTANPCACTHSPPTLSPQMGAMTRAPPSSPQVYRPCSRLAIARCQRQPLCSQG